VRRKACLYAFPSKRKQNSGAELSFPSRCVGTTPLPSCSKATDVLLAVTESLLLLLPLSRLQAAFGAKALGKM
jgi:hypothetical protein